MTRFALTLEYDGGPFMGLQRQPHGPSVQQAVEEAAFAVLGEQVTLHAAGRTDTGVHALAMRAHIDVAKPLRAIGTNTVACMQSGVYWGYIGLIEGIVREVRRERDRPMKVIATGGLASLFAQGTELFHSIEDDLTMHGLVLINAYNKDTP